MISQFFKEDAIELEDLGGGLKRKILAYNDHLMVVKVAFETGALGYEHAHVHDQVTYCLSGEFKYQLEGATYYLKAGDSVVVHGNQKHGLECLKEGVLLDIFAPARKDFL